MAEQIITGLVLIGTFVVGVLVGANNYKYKARIANNYKHKARIVARMKGFDLDREIKEVFKRR